MASRARYYDGVTAQALEVTVRPSTLELVISRTDGVDVVARWPISEIRILGDSEHEAVPPLSRGDERLMVEDAELRRQIALAVPQLAKLAAPKPSAAGRIAVFGTTFAALLGLFWVGIDVGSELVAPLVPYSLQARLGNSVTKELVAGHQLCTNPAGLAAINGLANRLAKAADYGHPVKVTIIRGGPMNAFTLPGGQVVFYSDLIDKAHNGNEVAGVLAHEMGHAVHYHSMKGLARQYGLNQLLRLMTGGYSDLGTVGAGGGLLLALQNGRNFERDADSTGVLLLEKLGLRADGVSEFFADLEKAQPTDRAAQLGIWSTHPPTAERIAATKRPSTGTPAFSDEEWAALRAVCGPNKENNPVPERFHQKPLATVPTVPQAKEPPGLPPPGKR
jgi:Zn-dependent protease with chaperone function